MSNKRDNLIWIDLEMTGLDTDNDVIIEIATLVTDKQLNVIAEGPMLAIHQPDEVLAGMDEWNTTTHTASGLVERIRQSRITAEMAEQQTLEFLQQHVERGMSPMCGNSICQDRRFLHRLMPRLEDYFHYRNLDVSSIKELVRRWKPEVLEQLSKSGKHLAMDDIKESVAELQFYREKVFNI